MINIFRINGVKIIQLLVIGLTLAFFSTLMFSNTTNAAYDDLETWLYADYDQYISDKENEPVTGKGNYTPEFQFLVYSEASSPANYIDVLKGAVDAEPSCSQFDIYQSRPSHDDRPSNNGTTIVEEIRIHSGSSTRCQDIRDGFRVYIPFANRFNPSYRFGSNYIVTSIRLQLKDDSPSRFVDIHTRNSGNDRLSYIGDQTGTSAHTSRVRTGVSFSRIDSGFGTIRTRFAPSCNYSSAGGPVTMWWKDADSGDEPNSGRTVTYRLYEDGVQIRSGNAGSGGSRHSVTFNARAGAKYRMDFDNVRGRSSGVSANTIKVWFPFDSASYYKDCGTTNGWRVVWSANYILRNDGRNLGYTAGDVASPENGDAPQPGQSFRYINDARNAGTRDITNRYWSCPSGSGTGTRCRDHPTNNSLDRWWNINNYWSVPGITTAPHSNFNIAFDRSRTGQPNDTYSLRGNGTASGAYIGGPGWVWDTFNVSQADGGRTRCVGASFWPGYGVGNQGNFTIPGSSINTINGATRTTSWTIPGPESRVNAPTLCVNVPYYYTQVPTLNTTDTSSGNVVQGNPITVVASVANPSQTSGRNHTHTESKTKGVVELVVPPGVAEPGSKGANNSTNQGPCAYMQAKVSGATTCNLRGTTNAVVNAGSSVALDGSRTGAETIGYAVGTKYCYAAYANHPRHTTSSDVTGGDGVWAYSSVSCVTIVKSPKVHFLNTDVTTGKKFINDGTGCIQPEAEISTVGAPAVIPGGQPASLYGSWVAYGAFATGSINQFGSAAVPYGLSGRQPHKLAFGNNNFTPASEQGRYTYGSCLSNPFALYNGGVNLESHSAFAIDTDNPSQGILTLQNLGSEEGYVSTKTIHIGQKTVTAPPPVVPPNSVMSTVTISARSVHANPGSTSCPKLQVIVTGDNSSRDQDTKPICNTAQQNYEYTFYLPTSGPNTIDARFVNDSSGAGAVNRDIQIASIAANGKNLYTGSTNATASGVSLTLRGAAANKSSCRSSNGVLLDVSHGSGETAYCYGSILLSGNLNAPLSTQNPSYVPPESKTIQVTARGTIYDNGGAGRCPYMYISVNNGQRQDLQEVCSASDSTYTFTTNVGDANVDTVEVGYDPMDRFGGGQDRNLYVSNIRVGDVNIPINSNSGSQVQLKNGNTFVAVADAPDTCKRNDTAVFMSATDNVVAGWCAVVRVNNVTPPPPPQPPVPPLDSDFEGFRGRDVLIYAQKNASDTCSDNSSGTIVINKDVLFKRDGYNSIFEIPRLVFMADCNIVIDDDVSEVNASLVAGGAIKTCVQRSTHQGQCNKALTVGGTVSAAKLLLWRTHGADLSQPDGHRPAETFDVSPAQIIATYNREQRLNKPSTVYEVDLPPRY